jgi:hypothetical protein
MVHGTLEHHNATTSPLQADTRPRVRAVRRAAVLACRREKKLGSICASGLAERPPRGAFKNSTRNRCCCLTITCSEKTPSPGAAIKVPVMEVPPRQVPLPPHAQPNEMKGRPKQQPFQFSSTSDCFSTSAPAVWFPTPSSAALHGLHPGGKRKRARSFPDALSASMSPWGGRLQEGVPWGPSLPVVQGRWQPPTCSDNSAEANLCPAHPAVPPPAEPPHGPQSRSRSRH